MKKLYIHTIIDYLNYGNRLQNYALNITLQKYSKEVTTLVISKNNEKRSFSNRIKHLTLRKLINHPINIKKRLFYLFYLKHLRLKKENFRLFTNKYITEKSVDLSTNNISFFNGDFSIVVGSDQIWNYNYRKPIINDFLLFSRKQNNIAYAPSFGINNIPTNFQKDYTDGLSNFNHLSVREDVGKEIINKLLGIEVPVLVDPTLLLTKEDWVKIARPHEHKPNKKYLLTYYLGEEKKHNLKFIKKYAKLNNLELVQLGDIKDKKRYTADPSEFIDYFKDASMIFTDSFHGSVFSIIFKKPFVVFKRGNMNSRIDTLLSKFNLVNRHWDYVKEHKNFNEIDYSHVDEIINDESKKSYEYLRNALGIKEEE